MMNRNELVKEAKVSWATLKQEGFEKVCSVIAGEDSGSVWLHEDGRKAEVLVRNGNKIQYS